MAQIFMNPRKPYIHPRPKGKFACKPFNQFTNIIRNNSTELYVYYDDIVVITPSLCVVNKITAFSPLCGRQMSHDLYAAYESYNIAAKFKNV